MNKIKVDVHPSVLVVLFIMAAIVFFFSIQREPEIILPSTESSSVIKTPGDVYGEYPEFPYVSDSTGVYAPFVLDGDWWVYDRSLYMFVKSGKY